MKKGVRFWELGIRDRDVGGVRGIGGNESLLRGYLMVGCEMNRFPAHL